MRDRHASFYVPNFICKIPRFANSKLSHKNCSCERAFIKKALIYIELSIKLKLTLSTPSLRWEKVA